MEKDTSLQNSLENKKEILFFDGVDPIFAQQASKIFPNYIFFTTNNELWKGGIRYTGAGGVNESKNEIVANGNKYKIFLNEQNLLEIRLEIVWNWYIGKEYPYNGEYNSNAIVDTYSSDTGWRYITNEEKYILNKHQINPFICEISKLKDKYNVTSTNINGFCLYTPHNSKQQPIKLDFKENEENYSYLALPTILVSDYYKIGLYDTISLINPSKSYNILKDNQRVNFIDNFNPTGRGETSMTVYKIQLNEKYFIYNLLSLNEESTNIFLNKDTIKLLGILYNNENNNDFILKDNINWYDDLSKNSLTSKYIGNNPNKFISTKDAIKIIMQVKSDDSIIKDDGSKKNIASFQYMKNIENNIEDLTI